LHGIPPYFRDLKRRRTNAGRKHKGSILGKTVKIGTKCRVKFRKDGILSIISHRTTSIGPELMPLIEGLDFPLTIFAPVDRNLFQGGYQG